MNWQDSDAEHPVRYLTASDVVAINEAVTGGAGIRELRLLDSALRRPALVLFGQAQFPSLLEKAAAYMHSLAYHHLFFDGNKRTAVRAVDLFLSRNGMRLSYTPATDDAFVLEIAQGQHDVERIAQWLAERVAPS
jgi:death-on-curing protein